MAYIGSTPTSQNFTSGTDYFSGTGSQTAFTLTRTVNSVNDIEVVINNVIQQPNSYTLSGTTLTLSAAPSSGTSNVYVRYLSTNMQSFTVPANSIDYNKLSSDVQNDLGMSFKNRIINGDMRIDQRNAGASVTSTGSNYSLDRWKTEGSVASKFTVQQNAGSVTPPVGFKNYLGVTSSSAYSVGSGDYFAIAQYIEGLNATDLAWGTAFAKTVTLSFQVYSSLTGTFSGSIINSGNNRSYPFTYTISSANTWTLCSVTIPGDTTGTWLTDNGINMKVWFSLGVGSTYAGTAGSWAGAIYLGAPSSVSVVGTNAAKWYVTGVQLEVGASATPFDTRAYGTELALCQRYYQRVTAETGSATFITGVICSGATSGNGGYQLMSPMRSSPTLDSSASSSFSYSDGAAAFTVTSLSIASSQTNSRMAAINFSTAGGLTQYRIYRIEANSSATAYLGFSAEL